MASVAQGSFVAINGIDLSGVLKKIDIKASAELKDSTTLGDTVANKFTKGLTTHSVSGEGFFKSSATPSEDANTLLQTALTNQSTKNYLLMVAKDGTTEGNVAECLNLVHASYSIEETVGELLMANFEGNDTAAAQADAGTSQTGESYQLCVVLFSDTATGAVNGASYDAGGSATGWFLQVQMLDGDDAATLKLQHSTNNSTWADLYDIGGSYGDLSQNTAYQFSSTSDSVNRYTRLIVTAIAGTTNTIVAALRLEYAG